MHWGSAGQAVLLAAASLYATASFAADAPPEKLAVKRFIPMGAAAGGTVVVKVEGTFPRWPVRVWVDRGGTTWMPREEQGSFDVTVAADAVGVYRVRMYDDREAAEIRRFVVGTVPEAVEVEPNDRPQEPQAVSMLPVTINGVLEKAGDVDGYGVDLEVGQTLVAAVDAQGGPAAPLDAVLEVVDERGGYLARNLDAHGLDPRIIFTAARSGRHVVRVYGFPAAPNQTIGFAGGSDHVYRLTLTTGGFVAAALPAAVNRLGVTPVTARGWNLPAGLAAVPLAAEPDSESTWVRFPDVAGVVQLPVVAGFRLPVMSSDGAAVAVEPPLVASGLFTSADQELTVRITAKTLQPLLVAAEASRIGSEAEAVLHIRGADGRSLISKSDRDPAVTWTPPTDDDYAVTVRDRRGLFGPGHFCRVSIVTPEPQIMATCESDMIAVTMGGSQELAIAVERVQGWREPVEFVIIDPPAGIAADPVVSAAEGDSAKKATLTIKAEATFNGPLTVVARHQGAVEGTAPSPVATVRFGKERLPSVWVSVSP